MGCRLEEMLLSGPSHEEINSPVTDLEERRSLRHQDEEEDFLDEGSDEEEEEFQHLLSERLTSLGIMGEPPVPPLSPSETIVLSEHYRL